MSNNEQNPSANLLAISRKEALILEMLLASRADMFGLEMVEASGGNLKRGTIYVTLQRMKEKGFVESRPEPRAMPEIGISRRLYRATGLGERALAAQRAAQSIWVVGLSVAET
jgi:PadR family transcriptional regulator, regulatory protein PadR